MKTKLNQVMSSKLVAVPVNEGMETAYKKMKLGNIRHLPVLDEDGNISGILSDRDFQRAMWPVGVKNNEDSSASFRVGAVVGDYMSWPVQTVESDMGLSNVVKLMIEKKISAVLVTSKQELVGIVTVIDVLRVLDSILEKPPSLKERVLKWTYDSPIGQVIDMVSNAGL